MIKTFLRILDATVGSLRPIAPSQHGWFRGPTEAPSWAPVRRRL
jgi:hypothetical protein